MKIGIVRGKNLNKFEMQSYEPLAKIHDLTAYTTYDHRFDLGGISLPIRKLHCLEEFSNKLPSLFRHGINQLLYRPGYNSYMIGLESELEDKQIAHVAETFNGYSYQAIKAKQKYGSKIVVTAWENIPHRSASRFPVFLDNNRMREEVRRKADAFIAISRRSKAALILEGVSQQKIYVIPAGVDIGRFRPREKDQSLLESLGLDSNVFTALFIGRLVPEKGIFTLIYAAKLIDMDPELSSFHIKFLIVGDGPSKHRVKALVERLNLMDNVYLREEFPYSMIHKLYNSSDVFILPSTLTDRWQEQFGMVLVEAMASGCPIISTLSGAIPEVVGNVGVLLQPDDALSLYEAMKKLIRHRELMREMSEMGRQRAKKYFDSKKIADQLDAVYSSLIS